MSWNLLLSACWLEMLGLPAVRRAADSFMSEQVNVVTKVVFLDGVFVVYTSDSSKVAVTR